MTPPDRLEPFELLKLMHAQKLDFSHEQVGALLAEVERLRGELHDEAYEHAACLSIAEGAPGWREFEPKRLAGHAVKALRERAEKNLPPGVTLEYAKAVSEAVAEAVAAEREACIQAAWAFADANGLNQDDTFAHLEAAIRARGEGK